MKTLHYIWREFILGPLELIVSVIAGIVVGFIYMILLTPVAIFSVLFGIWRMFGGPKPKSWTKVA